MLVFTLTAIRLVRDVEKWWSNVRELERLKNISKCLMEFYLRAGKRCDGFTKNGTETKRD